VEPSPHRPRVILVPVDFDNPSRYALNAACELAARIGANVVIAHVCSGRYVSFAGGRATVRRECLEQSAIETAERRLREFAVGLGDVRTIVRQGDPASRILALIDELHPVLVVVGTQGRRGLARLVLGSIAEKIVRSSPVPVLSVSAPPFSGASAA
jgi:nucleotide-binding universal stress UspA family protein